MPSIETRKLADGTTRYFVRVRDHERGKYTSATFATEPEARRFVADVEDRGVAWALAEHRRAEAEGAEATLNDWAETHFSAITRATPATIARYRRIYRQRWAPHLGHMRLSTITRVDVARALNAQAGKDKTVLNAWGVLTHMLKQAAADGLIPRSPTIGVRPARVTSHEDIEHRYLTQAEFWRVLDSTPPHWTPLILFLAGTGCRWGEATALTVGDVDLAAMTVRIVKAEKQDPDHPGRVVIGPTKSRKSRRTVTLPAEVCATLAPIMAGRTRTDRLFLAPRGGPVRHRTFYVDLWRKTILRRAELEDPPPRLHDLRHSHVAWLIAAGAQLPVIQARLGHEKITTTIDTYGHLLPDIQRAAAEAASLVLGSRPEALESADELESSEDDEPEDDEPR